MMLQQTHRLVGVLNQQQPQQNNVQQAPPPPPYPGPPPPYPGNAQQNQVSNIFFFLNYIINL